MIYKNLVSIVVAIYQSESFLPKLLDSIRQQTYKNIEVILVDDGSPDNSGNICDKYARIDSRFRVIHQENKGACQARNVGIDAATGDYLLIIDGDDWIESDHVEYLLSLATNTSSDMAMTDSVFTTIDRKQIRKDRFEILSPEKASALLVYPVIPIGPWNKIYNLRVINQYHIRFISRWSGEGLIFSCLVAQCSNQVCLGHKKTYNYRLNNLNSGLTNYNLEMATNALENINLLKRISLIQSPYLETAYNWNIWKNNYFVMYLVIATNSRTAKKDLYNRCKEYTRREFWCTFRKSDVLVKEKIKMIIIVLMPEIYAKIQLYRKKKQLVKDRMR